MRRRRRHPAREMAPNLAPMVDVVMVILIFFMLGAGFAVREGALPSELPSQIGPGGEAKVMATPVVRIRLEEAAPPAGVRILVMEQPLSDATSAALHSFMRSKREQGADPRGQVLISAGPTVRYKHVIAAFNACVRAGYENVKFSMQITMEPLDATVPR